jgi:dTDP-4-amino-4,6-dideoxygalactose transaminase
MNGKSSLTIPLAEPSLDGNEARYLQECVATNFVSSVGPFVARFEDKVAAATGARHCVATSSGTTALHLALTAIGVRRDDLVIVPTYTFIASANAVSHCGAIPWLLDITADSWTLDADLLKRVLANETGRGPDGLIHLGTGRRIGAILPVYTLGLPADMDAIVAVADEFGIPVVADAAAAHGATYKTRPLAEFGARLSVLSFNGNKTVTAGAGGCIVGNDEELMAYARHLSSTARMGREYDHDNVGFNYRLSNLSAAVGLAQMERLTHLVASKRRIWQTYNQSFANLSSVSLFPDPDWAEHSCWLSGIVVHERMSGFAATLARIGVEIRQFWKPMHLQQPYRNAPRTPMPVSESIWDRIVILPSSSGLRDADQSRIIDAVRDAFS